MTALVEHVRVNHCRIDILMPQQFLNGANVISVFQQLGRKGMSKGLTANMFNNSGLQNSFLQLVEEFWFPGRLPSRRNGAFGHPERNDFSLWDIGFEWRCRSGHSRAP